MKPFRCGFNGQIIQLNEIMTGQFDEAGRRFQAAALAGGAGGRAAVAAE